MWNHDPVFSVQEIHFLKKNNISQKLESNDSLFSL